MQLPRPLVDAAWLAAHHTEVRVVDSRWYLDGRSGRAAYDAGHIPGAVWVDLDRELSAAASGTDGRHPLPTPEVFAATLSRLGIGEGTPVVVYDDARGSVAARLWWMLHVFDHPVAVLDGGLPAWTGALDLAVPTIDPAGVTPRPWPAARFVDADAIESLRASPEWVLLDARAASRFAAGDPAIDPRPGHIPGAKSAPWTDNVAPDGTMLDREALRLRFTALGAADAPNVACYCGSGVTACHDLLALEIAGFGAGSRLYPGSWSQWGADPARPAATGSN